MTVTVSEGAGAAEAAPVGAARAAETVATRATGNRRRLIKGVSLSCEGKAGIRAQRSPAGGKTRPCDRDVTSDGPHDLPEGHGMANSAIGTRRLGALEVSTLGLGCM